MIEKRKEAVLLNKSRIKKPAIVISASAVLIACALLLAHFNYHVLYVAAERAGLYCERIAVTETTTATAVLAYGDTLGDRIAYTENMMLVNTDYALPSDYRAPVSEYKQSGVYMNGEEMLSSYACLSAALTEATGDKLYVSSDYRSKQEQEVLYQEDPDTATAPSASEHQSGLCLDVYVSGFAGDGFLKSPSGRFVNSHAHEYGFIIRYPSYGKDKTGIRFEPWHIRYVGEPHAGIIYNNHITLEEHILGMVSGVWYEADGYLFSRQYPDADGTVRIPQEFTRAEISPDNTGAYIITVKK